MSYKTEIPKQLLDYINIVEMEIVPVCKEQKLLIKLVRKAFETEELIYNVEQIEKYLSYQKYFPFDLFPWEVFVFILHNCIFRKRDGLPRWKDLFMIMGRGGGKNGYLAFEDFCLVTETNGIAYYDIDICANSEDQAKTSFMDIYNVLDNPQYKKIFEKNFSWNLTRIVNKKTKSTIRFRTNSPKSKDGLRSGKVDFDEVHQYENFDNIKVFTTGLGKKPHPRRTYVSTNGDVRDGVFDSLLHKAEMILEGEIEDNGFLPVIFRLDNEKEVENETNWNKANPSYQYLSNLQEEMKTEFIDYQLDPIANSDFMTKRMNIAKAKSDMEAAEWEDIKATNQEMINLEGKSCILGIDYTKATDFMATVLLFKIKGKYYGIHHSWYCTACKDLHRIKPPLKEWEEKGYLTKVDSKEINPEVLTDWIREQMKYYDIRKLVVDDYRYGLLKTAFRKIGFDADDKDSDRVKMTRPSDIMKIQPIVSSAFRNHLIVWGDEPMMRWYTRNTKLEPAPNNNFKYGKIEPKSRKTDGFMAFINAMVCAEELPEDAELTFMNTITF